MPTYNAQGQYVDKQGNPAPNPADASPGISQGISNLLGMPFTPGRDSGLPHETPIDPVHALQALESGKSGWGTYMPIQVGTTGGTVPMRGINEAQLATQQSGVQTAMPGDPMNLTGEPSVDAGNLPLPGTTVEGPGEFEPGAIGADVFEDPNALDPFGDRFDQPTANSPVKKVAPQTADIATAVKEPPAEATEPVTQPVDTSGQAGFEKVLNLAGGGADWVRDLLMGGVRDVDIGLHEFFKRPTPENLARIQQLEDRKKLLRDESVGDIGTQLYDQDWSATLDDILNAVTTDEPAGVTVGMPHTMELTPEELKRTKAANERLNTAMTQSIDEPSGPVGVLTRMANTSVEPTGTDRFAGQSKPPPPRPSAPGTDIEAGVTTLPLDSANTPLVDLVNQLAPLSGAQRANMLKQLDPQDRKIILDMLNDRDEIDNTGIVD